MRYMGLMGLLAQGIKDAKVELGKPLPSFTLPHYDGTPVLVARPSARDKQDITVLVFVSTKCSFSNDYNVRLAKFSRDYAARVRVIGINSNTGEKPDAIAKHAKDNDLPYPILKDEGNVIADRFQAQKTPEFWVVDGKGILRYHGAFDDHFEEAQVKKTFLVDAITALLAGKEPPVRETALQGCTIKRERRR